jgi:hypothetical protein
MGGLAVGVTGASTTGSQGGIVLDPEAKVAQGAAGRATVGVLPALGVISDVWMTGELEVDELVQVSGPRMFPASKRSPFQ